MENNRDYLATALRIMYLAHDSQLDKSGNWYSKHPIYVASKMDTEEEKIVALLHDVIEDSDFTFDNIINEGFSHNVIDALVVITKREYEPYEDYINRVKENKLATKVKLADLEHNMDLSRLKEITDRDIKRNKKYENAKNVLLDTLYISDEYAIQNLVNTPDNNEVE